MTIDTESFSEKLRSKAIDTNDERLLITNFQGSEQEQDFKEPANCDGFGRIRHFHRIGTPGWPENPLPVDPAAHKLGQPSEDVLRAQVFQNAACNWRCWYCFVPFALLNASTEHSAWLSAGQLLDLYQKEVDAPLVIDLSGGQPDLTPEWVPWMMRELRRRDLDQTVYLWSDDNLSNDYFWRYLSGADIDLIKSYRNYGKVCCFKGFDAESFAFNTQAAPNLFAGQLALFRRYLALGIDIYAYATFTAAHDVGIGPHIAEFVDQLQAISVNLPLRVIPLEVQKFAPVHGRMTDQYRRALDVQWSAIEHWNTELQRRFSGELRQKRIYEVLL